MLQRVKKRFAFFFELFIFPLQRTERVFGIVIQTAIIAFAFLQTVDFTAAGDALFGQRRELFIVLF